ncbi:MAG: type II toxin-antitoxin system HicA family toxin [Myxococcota bacterium]|nr:type II toxin-antitoxin system HicA family toxin [Myxococcota bacterium]
MNKRQRRTLARVFERPTRSDVRWDELASLLRALGAEEREGAGSRVRFVLAGSILSLHRPHPKPELRKYAVEDVRQFLAARGIEPEEE